MEVDVEIKPVHQAAGVELTLEERMIYRTIEFSHSSITDHGIVNAWSPSFRLVDVKEILRALKAKGRIVEERSGGYVVATRANRATQSRRSS